MVHFKLGEEKGKDGIFIMSRALDKARLESSSSSVVRASDRCTEGQGFAEGTRIFSLYHACDMLNISSFLSFLLT